MRRTGNPHALLVGMQISTATVENSMEALQEIKNRTITQPSNSTSGYFYEGNKNTNLRKYVHPTVSAALFTVA